MEPAPKPVLPHLSPEQPTPDSCGRKQTFPLLMAFRVGDLSMVMDSPVTVAQCRISGMCKGTTHFTMRVLTNSFS